MPFEAGEPSQGDAVARPGRSRRSLVLRVLAVLALLLLALAVFRIAPYLSEGDDYATVVSIERRADYRNPALMAAAWRLPVATIYRRKPFEYQTNPSFCGPASAANLLRSLGRDLSQAEVIDGTEHEPWFGLLIGGMTLDEVADLLRTRAGPKVTIVRDPSLAEFRAHLRRANDPAKRYIVNFHRGPLFGRGHGHFSPVLAYLVDRDLVLVGDVNRSFRPFLVSSERLWRATDTVDAETGKERGLLFVEVERRP